MIKLNELNIVVPHPGIYVKDAIDSLNISQTEFAIRADITPKVLSTLINGESNLTFEIAYKLSSFFGNSVEMWLNLQSAFEIYQKKQNDEDELKKEWNLIKLIDKEFLKKYCNIVLDCCDKKEIIKKLREQFMVGSIITLTSPDLFSFCRASVRKDTSEKEIFLRNIWISLAYKKSQLFGVCKFSKQKLLNSIDEIKSYTLLTPEEFTSLLKNKLAECGIKYIELPYLKGSNTSGVTRWLSNEEAIMVAINDCGKDADKIWFTLFHELGHAINNHKRHLTISLTKNSLMDEEEIIANKFAEDSLINPVRYEDFKNRNNFSISGIKQFAKEIGVAPFVVIGRLQKDKIIGFEQYQDYKVKYSC